MRYWRIAILQWIPVLLLRSHLSGAQELFDRFATLVIVHDPESTKGLRNRTTNTVVVPEDAGNVLGSIVLHQLPNLDQLTCGPIEPRVCLRAR